MGRTKGSLGKKTLEKMKETGEAGTSTFITEANMPQVTMTVPMGSDVISISEGEPATIEVRQEGKKKRGRKSGSKNKSTKQDEKEKSNFNGIEKDNDSIHNNIENYYKLAIESNKTLKKRLEKEVDGKIISAISSSILCNDINISRFLSKMGGKVVGEDEVMSGDGVAE
jgi:hypothetical protein